jgi:hypothetical protein
MYFSASHTGSGRLTFDSFAGPIIATGVASTSLVITLIIYFWKKKQGEAENCNSDPILRQEEIKERGDETFQWQKKLCRPMDKEKGKRLCVMVHLSFIEVKGFLARKYQVPQDFRSVVLGVTINT